MQPVPIVLAIANYWPIFEEKKEVAKTENV